MFAVILDSKMSISLNILIVGGGAADLAVASSLYKRNSKLDIAVIEPSEKHYYQPGWTMVGAGVFDKTETGKNMIAVWVQRCETDQILSLIHI